MCRIPVITKTISEYTSLLCCSLFSKVIMLRNLLYILLISALFPKTSDIRCVFTYAASWELERWCWVCVEGNDPISLSSACWGHSGESWVLLFLFSVHYEDWSYLTWTLTCVYLFQILRCGPPPMNKAMVAHLDELNYTKEMQFQF